MIGSPKVLGALIRVGYEGRPEGPMTPETFRRFVKQYAPNVYTGLARSLPALEIADLIPAAIRMFELQPAEADWLREVLEHFRLTARVDHQDARAWPV